MKKHETLRAKLFNQLMSVMERRQIKLEELSEALEISKDQLIRYKKGQRIPGYDTLISIAEELNLDIESLLTLSPDKEVTIRFNKLNPYEKAFIIQCFDMIENLPETAKLMFSEEIKK